MLQLSDVSFRYNNKPLLESLSVELPIGQIIGLVGENGSGKSTLLKLIAGILRPTNGEITVNGMTVTRRSADQIAYLPDTDLFYEFYTAEEVFRFYESQFRDFSYDKACIIAQYLDIDKNVKLKNLSKGNRGRVKMAATLGRDVPFYLMDEPFSGLDPMVRESLIKGLIRFTDVETQTILLSTHEVHEVEPILDQILLLKSGRIYAQEDVESIRDLHNQNAVQWMKSIYNERVK
ncbi:ABC transporter ATP-binding protein [Solibacillus sp. CAU 1738]|uniref:ABC transporter ATP-binding protein n=1 Tax=Solibacillus sp. CAU 1738 TaxID=3140363 RepID=UPI003261677B